MSVFGRLVMLLMAALLVGAGALAWAAGEAQPSSASAPATSATAPATRAAMGKDIIVMDELVASYEPVPFLHRKHAQMSEMWDGCGTCHHHQPIMAKPTASGADTQPTTLPVTMGAHRPSKDDAGVVPACKSCHPVAAEAGALQMPSLKGAYHRLCLNCHRDWMGNNACGICHATREAAATTKPAPTADDIVGRMHQPIPEPKEKSFTVRYAPVAGAQVLFRHEEHVKTFGLRCVACHRRDSCTDCHAAPSATGPASAPATQMASATRGAGGPRPVAPAATWRESHGPCIACHAQDRCNHCHYQPDTAAPPAFAHATTGQTLDKDHVKLACGQCHARYKATPGCGEAACHKRTVHFPTDRPGPFQLSTAATEPTTGPITRPATTEPTTRPTIIRVRRGGL